MSITNSFFNAAGVKLADKAFSPVGIDDDPMLSPRMQITLQQVKSEQLRSLGGAWAYGIGAVVAGLAVLGMTSVSRSRPRKALSQQEGIVPSP